MISLKRLSIKKSTFLYFHGSIGSPVLSRIYILLLIALFSITLFSTTIAENHKALAIEPIQYAFVDSWGSYESGDYPEDIAIDSSGILYVTDSVKDRIQKFSSDGTFIASWGSQDTENGQFIEPSGIAVDSSDNVYVVVKGENLEKPQVQKYTAEGEFITSWGSKGSGAGGLFYFPDDIAVDSSDNVYVADSWNNRIQKFDSNGNFITKWGSEGTGDGQFDGPDHVAVDSSGNVYVGEADSDIDSHIQNRVQKFDSNGNFITKLDFSSFVNSIAVDSSDDVYVAEGNTIKRYDSSGNLITEFVSESIAQGMAIDSSGRVYITSYGIEVYGPTK